MCAFFKKRSFLFWIIVALIFVLILLFLFGFRITYSPSLENNWTAIDAVSGWVSALGAIATIAVAIIVANRQNEIAKNQNEIVNKQVEISEQQNRIALFEKRFEYYNIIHTCVTVGQLLPHAKDAEAAVSLIAESFDKGNYMSHIENDKNPDYIKAHAIDAYDRVYEIMQKGEFLFEFETIEYLLPLMTALCEIVSMRGSDSENRYFRFAFTQYADKIDKELLPQIKKSLMQMKVISKD